MRKYVLITLTMLLAVAASGCVGKGQYERAVSEGDTAKGELNRVLAQKNALEQEVGHLRQDKAELATELELAMAELQRIKDGRAKEQASTEARVQELEKRGQDLSDRYRTLEKQYRSLQKKNKTLNRLVAKYKRELKKRPKTAAPASPPRAINPPAAKGATAKKSSQARLAPINVNTASANDMVLFLGLTKEVADKVVKNRPYRIKGELVAKNVVPKVTFDAIKDRITVVRQ